MSSASTPADHPAFKLRQELETYIVQKESPSRSFITKKSIERCWPDDLRQLQRKLGLSWRGEILLSILSRECRIIACILAWIKCDKFSEKLMAICQSIQVSKRRQTPPILKDSSLVLDQDKCVEIFDFRSGHLFYQSQFMFCPILISSAARGIREVQPEERWPYTAIPKEIGFGAFGRVYKAAIVKGQLQDTKDSSNDEEKLVAFKRVERPAAWRKEVKTLDFLKGSLSGHDRLLLHIAAFIQGSEFLIFLPHTPYGDLETFLREGTLQDDNSQDFIVYDFDKTFKAFDKLDLAQEFGIIIDATGYLHERVSSAKGLPVYCAHVDLRTKNILIFPGSDEHPAGIWKISDFGISSIQLEGGQALPEPVWSKHPSMGDIVEGRWASSGEKSTSIKLVGPHVAPEMSIHGIFQPKESDMWSLGCIFTEILVFGLGTNQRGDRKKKLEQFRKERCSWIGPDRDDYFFDRKLVGVSENSDEMQVTITRRQKVDEWLFYLHNECGELYHRLASVLDKMLQPDPRNRCTAKAASESVLKVCKSFPDYPSNATHIDKYKVKELATVGWKFAAVKQVVDADSSERLVFLNHLQYDNANSTAVEDEGLQRDPASSELARLFSFQRRPTIEAIKGPTRTWSEFELGQSRVVVFDVSSSYGILTYLCRKQEISSPKPRFPAMKVWKSSRKELYELRFHKEAEQSGDSEAYPSYSLPPTSSWCELRVIGRHAIVTGTHHDSDLQQQTHIYDFISGTEVKIPEDKGISKMHKFTSSGGEVLAAYDDKGFALWQSDKVTFRRNLSPNLGNSGQVTFSSDGSFLFTWSIYEVSKLRIWSIEPSVEPKVCASYNITTPNSHKTYEPLLVPCGSLAACIMRNRYGTWFTASLKMKPLPQGESTATEQNSLGTNLPDKAAICTANERYFFFLCEKGCVCICDLVWDEEDNLRIRRRPKALTKSSLKTPNRMVLYAKGGEKYDLIISNREGAIESIEVEC